MKLTSDPSDKRGHRSPCRAFIVVGQSSPDSTSAAISIAVTRTREPSTSRKKSLVQMLFMRAGKETIDTQLIALEKVYARFTSVFENENQRFVPFEIATVDCRVISRN